MSLSGGVRRAGLAGLDLLSVAALLSAAARGGGPAAPKIGLPAGIFALMIKSGVSTSANERMPLTTADLFLRANKINNTASAIITKPACTA